MAVTTAGTIIFAIMALLTTLLVWLLISFAHIQGALETRNRELRSINGELNDKIGSLECKISHLESRNERVKNELESYKNRNREFFEGLLALGYRAES